MTEEMSFQVSLETTKVSFVLARQQYKCQLSWQKYVVIDVI